MKKMYSYATKIKRYKCQFLIFFFFFLLFFHSSSVLVIAALPFFFFFFLIRVGIEFLSLKVDTFFLDFLIDYEKN